MSTPDNLSKSARQLRLQATIENNVTTHKRESGKNESWVREKILGHGGYGVVWLERSNGGNHNTVNGTGGAKLRAVKCIRVPTSKSLGTNTKHNARELEALTKFSQDKYVEYFVEFLGWFEVPGWLHIATEYCEHGDLGKYLLDHGRIPDSQVQAIIMQVLTGLSFMHEAGFAHRDLKPGNILIKSSHPDRWWVKLCDFGLSKQAEGDIGSTTVRGTESYMAPEKRGFPFLGDPRASNPFQADIWGLGETTFRALTGHSTFPDPKDLLDYQCGKPNFPIQHLVQVATSQMATYFVLSLMSPTPSARLNAKNALSHPWVQPGPEHSPLAADSSTSPPAPKPSVSHSALPVRDVFDIDITPASGQWTATESIMTGTPTKMPASLIAGLTLSPQPAAHMIYHPSSPPPTTGHKPRQQIKGPGLDPKSRDPGLTDPDKHSTTAVIKTRRKPYKENHFQDRRTHDIRSPPSPDPPSSPSPYTSSPPSPDFTKRGRQRTRRSPLPTKTSITLMNMDRVFAQALDTVKKFPKTGVGRPPPADRMRLYGLYKQAMEGDVDGVMQRPTGATMQSTSSDVLREQDKWDAWNSQKGLSGTEAKRRYVEALIETMHMHANTPDALELVAELEFVWNQVRNRRTSSSPKKLGSGSGWNTWVFDRFLNYKPSSQPGPATRTTHNQTNVASDLITRRPRKVSPRYTSDGQYATAMPSRERTDPENTLPSGLDLNTDPAPYYVTQSRR
ncbi:kinase-like domain-containing protein [Apodospora peruviana]|uniref:Autophagy-related protein 1 n=1 Tax=Apodospora peruviana TaxID=516989 RepID=A0AAE0M1T9_9PEZI|nr:kinase-like domain-containing protein [Apodospora peruviana]